jgi:hypothetical protein
MKSVASFPFAFGAVAAISFAACGGKVLSTTSDAGVPSGPYPTPTPPGSGYSPPGQPIDAGYPVPTPVDASLPSNPGCSGGCCPGDVSGFVPKWHPPKTHAMKCTQGQVDAYHQCLKDSSTQPPSCVPFGSGAPPANKACVDCIVTPDTAPLFGPLIVHKGMIELNVAGCIAIAQSDPNGTGCAGAYYAAAECRIAACSASCPVSDTTSFQAEQQCEADADRSGCAVFASKATCGDSIVQAGAAGAQCLKGQDFDTLYDTIVPMFCE